MSIWVIKHDGTKQAYSQEKIVNSLLRSGLTSDKIPLILGELEKQIYSGITTREIYTLLHQLVRQKANPQFAQFFRLREGLSKIGSFEFEKLISEILTLEGFNCQWNVIGQGKCIEHQIDVVAQKASQKIFIEVKHHKSDHRDTGLGDVIETWGRLVDIGDKFTHACLITNTKFSQHAKKFAACRGVLLLGWRYNSLFTDRAQDDGLEKILDQLGKDKIVSLINKVI